VTVRVRDAVAGDLPVLIELYRQLYPELDVRRDERTEAAWARTLATPDRTVLLAERDGAAAGTADLTVLANVARAGRPYLLVENVVVAEQHRRAGVGRLLLDSAADHARRAGCYKLQLSADDDAAFAFYDAAGLTASARTYKRYLDGESRDG
jgi:GNAT superfamily N-acetyltransferase